MAIRGDLQRQGYGTRMLALAEKFAKENKRTFIRIPAEEYSQGFYKKLGYISMDWPEGPHHPGEVSLAKRLKE